MFDCRQKDIGYLQQKNVIFTNVHSDLWIGIIQQKISDFGFLPTGTIH